MAVKLEKTYEDGVWFVIQELVIRYNQTGLAAEIARGENIDQSKALSLLNANGGKDERMELFIKERLLRNPNAKA